MRMESIISIERRLFQYGRSGRKGWRINSDRRRLAGDMATRRGSAAIELIAFAPIIALMVLIIIQVSTMFHEALGNVAEADARAAEAIHEWEMRNWNRGFDRPCVELIEPQLIREEGEPVPIGAGVWRREFYLPQEVTIANQPICLHR